MNHSTSLLVITLFIFSIASWFSPDRLLFLEIYSFLLGCSICWSVTVTSSLSWFFVFRIFESPWVRQLQLQTNISVFDHKQGYCPWYVSLSGEQQPLIKFKPSHPWFYMVATFLEMKKKKKWKSMEISRYSKSVQKIIGVWVIFVAQTVKLLPAMRETRVRFLGREDPLEKEMAIHSSTLAWKIP